METKEQIMQKSDSARIIGKNRSRKLISRTQFNSLNTIESLIKRNHDLSAYPPAREQYIEDELDGPIEPTQTNEPVPENPENYPITIRETHSHNLNSIASSTTPEMLPYALKDWARYLSNEEKRDSVLVYSGESDYHAKANSLQETFGDSIEPSLIYIAGCQAVKIPVELIKIKGSQENLYCVMLKDSQDVVDIKNNVFGAQYDDYEVITKDELDT